MTRDDFMVSFFISAQFSVFLKGSLTCPAC